MKKIIILITLILSGCSNDEEKKEQEKTCNCVKLYQKKTITQTSNSGWVSYGVNPEQTDVKDCSKDGLVIETNEFNSSIQVILYRRILSCK